MGYLPTPSSNQHSSSYQSTPDYPFHNGYPDNSYEPAEHRGGGSGGHHQMGDGVEIRCNIVKPAESDHGNRRPDDHHNRGGDRRPDDYHRQPDDCASNSSRPDDYNRRPDDHHRRPDEHHNNQHKPDDYNKHRPDDYNRMRNKREF